MRKFNILLTVLLFTISLGISAQNVVIKGKVTGPDKLPLKGAVVEVAGAVNSVQTTETGEFEVETNNPEGLLKISAEGYYEMSQALQNRSFVEIMLIPLNKSKYSQDLLLPYIQGNKGLKSSASENIAKKDLGEGLTLESAMQGEVAGLRVVNKGGMPGEGAYLNVRGIRSLVGNNTPLIVVNGIPYMPDNTDSPVIGGYSKGVFRSMEINDIQNITVLKGADASLYGSMGANGVILIETDGTASDNLDTRITFSGQYGLNWNSKTLPVLGVDDYKSYVSDIGMTYYDDMADLFAAYPFIKDDPDYYYNYLYNNNTNWQKEIYSPLVVTDNLFRIEGGDAIAKYDISLGYMKNGGVVDNTKQDNYHTLINTNIMINRKLELLTTVGLTFVQGQFQEQGMISATNPVLVAYNKAPVLSPYKKDTEGNVLGVYDIYRYGVSNPVAIVNTLEANNKMYDVNLRIGLNYNLNENLRFSGVAGLFYNYERENIFIPGVTSGTIIPMNNDLAQNTVRAGVGKTKNMFYNINGYYHKEFNPKSILNISAGSQVLTTKNEYDAGSGYNTASDFYQTLAYVESGSVKFYGYINEWNWMNFYGHADHTWNNIIRSSVNMAFDGASSSGDDAKRFNAFPSVGLTFMGKNLKSFINSSFVNRMDIRAEYGLTGNSRFSSNYGKNYYHSAQFLSLSGIVRSNIPNSDLKCEVTKQLNLGFDLSLLQHRVDFSADYFKSTSTDVLFAQPVSSVYGQTSECYTNSAEIENNGIELSLSAALIQNSKFEWVVGGNIATSNSEITSLGNANESILTFSNDDANIISRVGENPYSFYGLVAEGVFASQAQAEAADLKSWKGDMFSAGDVKYKDVKDDNVINEDDNQILGSAAPDFFGGFYTTLRYNKLTLSAEFTYSVGNEAYNGVRRSIEAMDCFNNQSEAVVNRWKLDGQITDVPRAYYGDPMGNNDFSSRWIEDASYVKMKSVTLNYNFDKTILRFFRSGNVYITGENLYTWTDYLGLDPEFSYSYNDAIQGMDYAKVVFPRTVKFGFNLKF